MKNKKIIIEIKKEELLPKIRAGVIYSKIEKDKKKYNRKKKHKKSKNEN